MDFHRLAGARLLDFAGVLGEDDFFVLGVAPGFAADAGEGRRDAVVVVLRPALERMVVALRALDADAQEELGRRLGGVLRVAAGPPVVGGRVLENAAAGGQQLAGELVERLVGQNALVDPAMELAHAGRLELLAVGAEDVAPLERPELGRVGAVDQFVDQPGPLVGLLAFEEGERFLGMGQAAGGVEVGAADEFFVAAEVGRENLQAV